MICINDLKLCTWSGGKYWIVPGDIATTSGKVDGQGHIRFHVKSGNAQGHYKYILATDVDKYFVVKEEEDNV